MALWKLTDHACRHCLARLLVSEDGKRVMCPNCEAAADDGVKSLCACGMKLKSGKSAGLRCIRNPNPTDEMPSRIVASAA